MEHPHAAALYDDLHSVDLGDHLDLDLRSEKNNKVGEEKMEKIDYIPEGFRIFELEDGRKFVARENGCLFCKHCTDILYDYTNGIYAIMCGLYKDTEEGMAANCKDWSES